jgi:hypothetical protein
VPRYEALPWEFFFWVESLRIHGASILIYITGKRHQRKRR